MMTVNPNARLSSVLLAIVATGIFLAAFLVVLEGPLNSFFVGTIQWIAPASTDISHIVVARYAFGPSCVFNY
jgi:hypothetical protein